VDGGRACKLFRRELSFEEGIEKLSLLSMEMFICSEYLHISHNEFDKFPREEKFKWYIYVQEKGKYEEKKQKDYDRKRKEKEAEGRGRDAPKSPGLKTT